MQALSTCMPYSCWKMCHSCITTSTKQELKISTILTRPNTCSNWKMCHSYTQNCFYNANTQDLYKCLQGLTPAANWTMFEFYLVLLLWITLLFSACCSHSGWLSRATVQWKAKWPPVQHSSWTSLWYQRSCL